MKTYLKLLAIIEAIARLGPITPRDLLQEVTMPRSTLQSILKDLVDRQWIVRTTSGYVIGPQAGRIGGAYLVHADLRSLARPELTRVAHRWGLTAHLGVMVANQQEVIYVDKVSGGGPGLTSYVGKTVPMHSTALGKVLFGYLPIEVQNRVIAATQWEAKTPNTLRNREALMDEVRRLHIEGVAWDREENEVGIRCIAAPIHDFRNVVVAALSLSGDSVAVADNAMAMAASLKSACDTISAALGWIGK